MSSNRRVLGTFVPVETEHFTGDVHVREDGPPTATPVLLVHGFSGSMHWFDRVVPLLADTFRLIRVDLVGHGCTGGPALDSPAQTDVVEAVLDKLGLVGVTAVGHSFGADVAVDLAERSSRVDRLVIVCQAPDYSDSTVPAPNRILTSPLVGAIVHRVAQPLGAIVWAISGATRGYPIGQELARQALLDFHALNPGMFKVILLDRRRRMADRPLDAQVSTAAVPTLAIAGGQDGFYGARYVDRYRDAGARIEIIDESGHSPIVEFPGRTARLLREFLQADPG